MNRSRSRKGLIGLVVFLILVAPLGALETLESGDKNEDEHLAARIARPHDDVASLDLFYGPGGKEHAPRSADTYKFIREVMSGTTPKFEVEDSQGTLWRVKMGEEAKTEVAATRLLWAAGYFVDEDYFVDALRVEGFRKLQRGREHVVMIEYQGVTEGVLRGGVRLERESDTIKEVGNWGWFDNPFVGTRELNGLRVMMALTNNWDLKMENNSIYAVDGERRYLVSDPGTGFGKTGSAFNRTENEVDDFIDSKFVKEATPDTVTFVMSTRPHPLTAVIVPLYLEGVHREKIVKDIPRADAKWLGQRLAQLTENQIRDCFRAAGYSAQEVDAYTKAVRGRITELNNL